MHPQWKNRTTLALALCLSGLGLSASMTSPLYALRVSAWTCVEFLISLLITTLIGIVAVLATNSRSVRLLDLAVSRGLEVTASLPIVLVCAVAVVTLGWRMPCAVALVTGALNGLTCLRTMTLGKSGPIRRVPFARFERALIASVSELVPQLVGLEAAVEFLGLLDFPWQGGLGKPLGTAVTTCNYTGIITWSLLCIGLSIATQQLLHRSPRVKTPLTQSAVQNELGPPPSGTAP